MRGLLLLLAVWGSTAWAEAHPPANTSGDWLQRMAAAAVELHYSGTFTYQRGEFSETSRIVHRSEGRRGIDRIETLSGRPRAVVRVGQDVTWYMPETRTVRVERDSSRRFFPGLLSPEQARTVAKFYEVSKADVDRVAGRDCINVVMTPKDAFRYTQQICADQKTLLPLRVVMLNERQERLESIAFTQIDLPAQIDANDIKPEAANIAEWSHEAAPAQAVSPWIFRELPAGFTVVSEHQRSLPGRSQPVMHKVLSDGMVWVSVFIEPNGNTAGMGRGLSQQGGAGAYTKPLGNHHVTVMGLVPVRTLVLIGNAVAPRSGTHP